MSSELTLKEIWARIQPQTSDKDSDHSYIDVYEKLFALYRDKYARFLEIGVGWGDCLLGWTEYFRNGTVVGLDYQPHQTVRAANMRVESGDSRSCDDCNRLFSGETFDIIIDDGDHCLESQRATFSIYRHLVRPGGVYVAEDVESIENAEALKQLGFEIIDRRMIKGRADDILAVWRPTE